MIQTQGHDVQRSTSTRIPLTAWHHGGKDEADAQASSSGYTKSGGLLGGGKGPGAQGLDVFKGRVPDQLRPALGEELRQCESLQSALQQHHLRRSSSRPS
jgi:hypothetical protein